MAVPVAARCVLGLAAILGAVLVGETWQGSPASQPARLTSPSLPAEAVTTASAPPVEAWANIALTRPLFSPDRRPAAISVTADRSLPRLSGTIRFADTALAIFEPVAAGRAAAGKPVTLGIGAQLSGWTVADIADGSVTLAKGGRIARLRLGFANRPIISRGPALASTTVLHDKRTSAFLQP